MATRFVRRLALAERRRVRVLHQRLGRALAALPGDRLNELPFVGPVVDTATTAFPPAAKAAGVQTRTSTRASRPRSAARHLRTRHTRCECRCRHRERYRKPGSRGDRNYEHSGSERSLHLRSPSGKKVVVTVPCVSAAWGSAQPAALASAKVNGVSPKLTLVGVCHVSSLCPSKQTHGLPGFARNGTNLPS